MWKPVFALIAAGTIAVSSLASAQQLSETGLTEQGKRTRGDRARMSTEDRQALTDARIAAIRTGLKLTPDQEKNWPAVETAIRNLSKQRADRMAARGDAPRQRDLIARMRARAETMGERAAGLKSLADASEPLYKSLDDGQKRRLRVLQRQAMRPDVGPRGRRR